MSLFSEPRVADDDADVSHEVDVVVVGGGQAGLAAGYYLRRAGLTAGSDFVILDAAEAPGGAWQHMWDGLQLFSPATYSSLPGWMMPPWDDARRGFPPRTHVVEYLTQYESRYELDVQRPHVVRAITRDTSADRLVVHADRLRADREVRRLGDRQLDQVVLADLSGSPRLRGTPAAHGAVPHPR